MKVCQDPLCFPARRGGSLAGGLRGALLGRGSQPLAAAAPSRSGIGLRDANRNPAFLGPRVTFLTELQT